MPAYSSDTLALARRLGAATLHEAAGRIGALPSTIKPVAPSMLVCGPAGIATAQGCRAQTVRSADELDAALTTAFAAQETRLVEVHVQ